MREKFCVANDVIKELGYLFFPLCLTVSPFFFLNASIHSIFRTADADLDMTLPIVLKDVSCARTPDATTLQQCNSDSGFLDTCTHQDDVGLACSACSMYLCDNGLCADSADQCSESGDSGDSETTGKAAHTRLAVCCHKFFRIQVNIKILQCLPFCKLSKINVLVEINQIHSREGRKVL